MHERDSHGGTAVTWGAASGSIDVLVALQGAGADFGVSVTIEITKT